MCKVSDKLKLCTCAKGEKMGKNYWIFYQHNKAKDCMIMGVPMLPAFISPEDEAFNSTLLLKLLNDGNVFDTDLHPKSKDRLLLSFHCPKATTGTDSNQLEYGFEYSRGKWKLEDFDPFEWTWKHDKKSKGKIENALQLP
jgi:hypothetical protein